MGGALDRPKDWDPQKEITLRKAKEKEFIEQKIASLKNMLEASEAFRQALLGYHYMVLKYRESLGVWGVEDKDLKLIAGTLDVCMVNMEVTIEDLEEKMKGEGNEP